MAGAVGGGAGYALLSDGAGTARDAASSVGTDVGRSPSATSASSGPSGDATPTGEPDATAALAKQIAAGAGQRTITKLRSTDTTSVVAHALSRVNVTTEPGGGRVLYTLTANSRINDLLVAGGTPAYPLVYAPVRPAGTKGYVDGSKVRLYNNEWRIKVDVTNQRLQVFKAGKQWLTSPIASGEPSTPTPAGRFFVTDTLRPPIANSVYGSLALELSGFSPVFKTFGTGEGEIGIHGTNDPAGIGGRISHGCVRVTNDVIEKIGARLPLGTPVDVVGSA